MKFNSQSKIIERAEFFSPDIIPERITGRSKQIEQLRQCLKPMETGCRPISAWLYGPPGTGKTVTARKVAQRCCNTQSQVWLYVNCWEQPTLYSVVQALCEQLKIVDAEAPDTSIKLARLRQVLKNKPMLIILDEIDRPMPKERDSIIYQLLQLPKTGLFCISSDIAAFSDLDIRVRSKLIPARLQFPKYSASEINAILTERALDGFILGACSEDILQKIASLAAGDARAGLHILLKAAIAAEEKYASQITAKNIPADMSVWRQLENTSRIGSLPQHQQVICKLAKRKGEISSTELRQLYLAKCRKESFEPVTKRTFSKYIGLLTQNKFITAQTYAGGGRRKLIKVVV